MATKISTPIKSHTGIFTTRTACGRIPLTPSPRIHKSTVSNNIPSPYTPDVKTYDKEIFKSCNSIYDESVTNRYLKHSSKTIRRDSPKSNIARVAPTPRRALELGVSEFTLTGTGPRTPRSSRKQHLKVPQRQKSSKTSILFGDRFIPNRTASSAITTSGSAKLEAGEKRIRAGIESSSVLTSAVDDAMNALGSISLNDSEEQKSYARSSPNTIAYQDSLANACGVSLNQRILAFKPAPPESSKPVDLRSQYNRPIKNASIISAQSRRRVATAPERVLDAPGLVDDYYLNLLDWSSGNQVAIGLERSIYIWSAETGTVNSLLETSPDTYVSSVKWSGDGAYVSVGLGTGEIQIWDVEEGTKLRSMHGHDTRVGVMGWNKHNLSSGARSGLVFNHDVRIAQHKVAELVSHVSEVCGLEWRSDGVQLATGGNDNLVSIWDARSLSVPKFTKTNHKAAVKALSWCPWQPNLLATGGGSYDRHIHFWNTTTGARVNSIDTGSQVTSLRWSPHYREIVSTSGFPDNSLSIWLYPTLVRHAEIPAHESRVLHSCLSPDGQMLATAAADESLKFWKIFEKRLGSASSTSVSDASGKPDMIKQMTIR
ncbi:WD40 repeat-like protein [Erysiphe pulchra]|uniref:WD40 repeat-like protein n=1 Tax=Erysiphe pulchra TaxID=225359 RepID=A0A2S4PRY3_9PEZI|nr:WD40 repeat-like protein [Erysiphe pulchra]